MLFIFTCTEYRGCWSISSRRTRGGLLQIERVDVDYLFQIWVISGHNGTGYFNTTGDDKLTTENFQARLLTGDTSTLFARTGYLGFIKRTDYTQTDGGKKK